MLHFTSDQHWGHDNVRGYCNRKFDTVEEMDDALVGAWNGCVKATDVVYHLGDFTLGNYSTMMRILYQLNGTLLMLRYPWHHDKRWLKEFFDVAEFRNIMFRPSLYIIEKNMYKSFCGDHPPIVLCHYPFAVWDRAHYGSIHLHGHSHGTHEADGLILDVGVDNAYKLFGEYRPFSIIDVMKIMNKKEKK
ncbi:hypothetical protein LCGC14_3003910 [marine sediment metagenome]|uniref:Calcineurin-like phosphoesterase domain-containing protein n=1 Tax=marine sediment metagenome TaxID=412755 RepID=A0A0F8ZRD7_9ZZZZ